jgi:hypothetical protein
VLEGVGVDADSEIADAGEVFEVFEADLSAQVGAGEGASFLFFGFVGYSDPTLLRCTCYEHSIRSNYH